MNTEIYKNDNGIEYYIVDTYADRALLFDFRANKHVIASGFDRDSAVWCNGRYFFDFVAAVLAWTLLKSEADDYLAWDEEDFRTEDFVEQD